MTRTVSAQPDVGIEIEFSAGEGFECHELGRLLWAADYSTTPRQADREIYPEVYTSHENGWRFETDPTVSGGEIISPRCQDNDELWAVAKNILECIIDTGGIISETRDEGFHVHVDASSLTTTAHWKNLFRLCQAYADELMSLAASEEYGSLRPLRSVIPLRHMEELSEPGTTAQKILRHYAKRDALVNTFHVKRPGNGHVEFKLWDGTLDVRTAQKYVALSRAIVTAASSLPDDHLITADDDTTLLEVLVEYGDLDRAVVGTLTPA